MTAEATDRDGSHGTGGTRARLERMVANITYGSAIPGDAELRLCGEIGDGHRAVELGVSEWFNSVEFAAAGAKAIAVDPDADRIAELRERADAAEVVVQCIGSELADLGDITSATCDVVIAVQSISDVDDLGRLLRQVHRILKPSSPFVISLPHPYAGVSDRHPYGSSGRTVGDWFTALGRANFRVDQLKELGADPRHSAPTTLVLRARKEGI